MARPHVSVFERGTARLEAPGCGRRHRTCRELDFLSDWLESDRANLTVSRARFADSDDYGPAALRDGFARFLLSGTTARESSPGPRFRR